MSSAEGFGGASAPRATSVESRMLVDGRSRLDARILPLVFGIGLLHAVLGLTVAEFLRQSTAAVLILSGLTVCTTAGILLRPNDDRFELFRAMSFFYFVAFCLSPLALPADLPWFYENPLDVLLLGPAQTPGTLKQLPEQISLMLQVALSTVGSTLPPSSARR